MANQICQRSGCTGQIVDGICEDCGRPALGQSLLSTAPQPSQRVTSKASTKLTASYPASRTTSGSSSKVSRRQTSRSTRGSSSRRRTLGGGLVSLPEMPSQDPLKLLMAKPEVPEKKRRCPGCDHKVNRTKGYCPNCGQEYNFEPALKAGDVVNGKFEVKGPIAFGGLGWIYLAWDQLLARWVILKGLLNAQDAASAAAAVAERQYLAAVKHSKIVGIYDFVNHGKEGFIVMEYVGGRTLESLRKDRDIVDVTNEAGKLIRTNARRDSLSEADLQQTIAVRQKGLLTVEEGIAYILGILPAFSYLHANNMVYCDFKPDNFMLEGGDVKLIDMGGVRRIGDPDGDIYGTRGYMAPEAADDPVAVSDLYTVGRALATLVMDFAYMTEFEYSLPTPAQQPLLAENEALYRFLLRATHPDPDERFQSAEEMSDQLYGVLREIVALKSDPKPIESKVFSSDNLINADDLEGMGKPLARLLPTIRVNPDDEAADDILRLGSIAALSNRVEALRNLAAKKQSSIEARLRLADALIAQGEHAEALLLLNTLEAEDPYDWRVQWEKGLQALASGNLNEARDLFDKVYFEMPGEIAPKLALAFVAEASADWDLAGEMYDRVCRVDPNQVSACFGLSRVEAAQKQLAGAVQALERVPATHSLSMRARITTAQLLLDDEVHLNQSLLQKAEEAVNSISAEDGVVHELAARLLSCALNMIHRGQCKEDPQVSLLGNPMQIRKLRLAAEAEYRNTARYSKTPEEKLFWIDLANQVRPVTLF